MCAGVGVEFAGGTLMRLHKSYEPDAFTSEVTFWVHKNPPEKPWNMCARGELIPPMPNKVVVKGYPKWTLEHRGHELYFASLEEIAHVRDVMGQKLLATSRDLSSGSGLLNQHWRSRLNRIWLPWKTRQKMAKVLETAN